MTDLSLLQTLLGGASGSLVGFTLGLVGGGGSILTVPLLVYLAGVPGARVAIGTSAVVVAANAAASIIGHARAGNVRLPCAFIFASAGIVGAFAGSAIGRRAAGQVLLAAFAVLMIAVAVLVLVLMRQDDGVDRVVRLSRENAPALIGRGLGVDALSDFSGIWRRLSYRARAGLCHRYADAPGDRHVAGRGEGLRRHRGGNLCVGRIGRLAPGRGIRRWWHAGQLGWRPRWSGTIAPTGRAKSVSSPS